VWRVNAPGWLRSIVESQGGTMLFAGEMPGEASPFGRVVLIPFDLQHSDLPLQIAFPVLVANAVEWLAPPQGLSIPASVKPGDVVPLPRDAIVLMPNGKRVPVDQRGFAQTDQLGIYTAQYKGTTTSFAVNFSNPAESNITPHPNLQLDGTPLSAQITPQYSQREIWPWLAVGALLLLLVEWWIYQRGLPVLRHKK
jgi:Ca-activated chloride channel homolog